MFINLTSTVSTFTGIQPKATLQKIMMISEKRELPSIRLENSLYRSNNIENVTTV